MLARRLILVSAVLLYIQLLLVSSVTLFFFGHHLDSTLNFTGIVSLRGQLVKCFTTL